MDSGLAGVVVNADTGEGALLTPAEREAALRFAIRHIDGRLPVVAGLLPSDAAEAAATARTAGDIGAAALQVFAPAVFLAESLIWEIVVSYYQEVADASDIPLIVYQAPAQLGVTFDVEILKRLADLPNVRAIKESSWSRSGFLETVDAFAGDQYDVALLSGEDTFILESLRSGADGAMLAAAAVDPAFYAAMFAQRHTAVASRIQRALDPYLSRLFAPPLHDFRARVKAVLTHDGVIACAAVRSPMRPAGAEEVAVLLHALQVARQDINRAMSGPN
jgi:dihydrodipicolinate synthase/N-acetylneuraminate lyase